MIIRAIVFAETKNVLYQKRMGGRSTDKTPTYLVTVDWRHPISRWLRRVEVRSFSHVADARKSPLPVLREWRLVGLYCRGISSGSHFDLGRTKP